MSVSTILSTVHSSGFEWEFTGGWRGAMMSVPGYWTRTCFLAEVGYTEVRGPLIMK